MKHAKQLKYDTNSVELREFARDIWFPRLLEEIHASKCNTNNNLGNGEMMNYDGAIGPDPEALQMDYRANIVSNNSISCEVAALTVTHNSTASQQQNHALDTFHGTDHILSYEELSNMLLNDDYLL